MNRLIDRSRVTSLISWAGPWVEMLLMAAALVWLWLVLAEDSASSFALLIMALAVTLGIGIYRHQVRASATRLKRALDVYAEGEIARAAGRLARRRSETAGVLTIEN